MEEITHHVPPCLLISHGKQHEKQSFYCLSNNRFHTTSIPELVNKHILASAYGWVVLVDHDTNECCVWNPSSMETIELPELDYSSIYNTCVVSESPTSPDCHVLFTSLCNKYQAFCRLGDDKYVEHSLFEEEKDISLMTAASFNGKIYAFTKPDHQFVTAHFDFTEETLDLSPILTEDGEPWYLPDPSPPWVQTERYYLIESSCGTELFLVRQMESSIFDELDFKVYQVDFNEMEFVELESIGDQAIFLSYYGGGFCCSSQGVESNTIYYTVQNSKNLYIYNLDDRSIQLLLPCPPARRSQSITYWVEKQIFQK